MSYLGRWRLLEEGEATTQRLPGNDPTAEQGLSEVGLLGRVKCIGLSVSISLSHSVCLSLQSLSVFGSYPKSSVHSRVSAQSPHSASGIQAWPLSKKREGGACRQALLGSRILGTRLFGVDFVGPERNPKVGLCGVASRHRTQARLQEVS